MGQSVVDLPDPLEHAVPQPLTLPSPAGVDDLLAQMAGDEIDRLLAEADAPRETPAAVHPQKSVPGEAAATPTPVVAGAAEPLAMAGRDTPAGEPAAPVPVAEVVSSEVDLESAMTGDERSALDLPREPSQVALPADGVVFDQDEDDDAPQEADESLPFYLKPLEWLNAPLEALPEGGREAVGKIALLTFFNAMAVLIYVIVFRKHR
jgi:hypothetical protein